MHLVSVAKHVPHKVCIDQLVPAVVSLGQGLGPWDYRGLACDSYTKCSMSAIMLSINVSRCLRHWALERIWGSIGTTEGLTWDPC